MSVKAEKRLSWKLTLTLFLGVGLLSAAGLSPFFINSQDNVQTIIAQPNGANARIEIEQLELISANSQDAETLANSATPTTDGELDSSAEYLGAVYSRVENRVSAGSGSANIISHFVGEQINASSDSNKVARLIIPKIGVNAKIQSVGLSDKGDGNMGIPTNFTDVAWYNLGPLPGEPGSAVIAGHVDGREVPRAVFYDISKLKAGDLLKVIDKEGKELEFKVLQTKIYNHNDSADEVFLSDTSKARLNLITCTGNWIESERIYDQRVVVFTELVE